MKRLGRDGPEVSKFGIGAMSFAGAYGDATVEQCHAVLDACYAAGVTHIDTANLYGMGRSEEIIGQWFAARPGARDRMILATKAGNTGQHERRFNNDPAYLETVYDSVDALQADLDAWLVKHNTERPHLGYRNQGRRPIETVMSFVNQEG